MDVIAFESSLTQIEGASGWDASEAATQLVRTARKGGQLRELLEALDTDAWSQETKALVALELPRTPRALALIERLYEEASDPLAEKLWPIAFAARLPFDDWQRWLRLCRDTDAAEIESVIACYEDYRDVKELDVSAAALLVGTARQSETSYIEQEDWNDLDLSGSDVDELVIFGRATAARGPNSSVGREACGSDPKGADALAAALALAGFTLHEEELRWLIARKEKLSDAGVAAFAVQLHVPWFGEADMVADALSAIGERAAVAVRPHLESRSEAVRDRAQAFLRRLQQESTADDLGGELGAWLGEMDGRKIDRWLARLARDASEGSLRRLAELARSGQTLMLRQQAALLLDTCDSFAVARAMLSGPEMVAELEESMITARLWPLTLLREKVASTPALSALLYEDPGSGAIFRITEEGTLLDVAESEMLTPPSHCRVAHPARSTSFADWTMERGAQPFEQRRRSVFHEPPPCTKEVPAAPFVACLVARGWVLEPTDCRGVSWGATRSFGDFGWARVTHSGASPAKPDDQMVAVNDIWLFSPRGAATDKSRIDPGVWSEVCRDLHAAVAFEKTASRSAKTKRRTVRKATKKIRKTTTSTQSKKPRARRTSKPPKRKP